MNFLLKIFIFKIILLTLQKKCNFELTEGNTNVYEFLQAKRDKRSLSDTQVDESGFTYYNIGVLMASRLDSPFDLERCGPAVDLGIEKINEKFLKHHKIKLNKVQER